MEPQPNASRTTLVASESQGWGGNANGEDPHHIPCGDGEAVSILGFPVTQSSQALSRKPAEAELPTARKGVLWQGDTGLPRPLLHQIKSICPPSKSHQPLPTRLPGRPQSPHSWAIWRGTCLAPGLLPPGQEGWWGFWGQALRGLPAHPGGGRHCTAVPPSCAPPRSFLEVKNQWHQPSRLPHLRRTPWEAGISALWMRAS